MFFGSGFMYLISQDACGGLEVQGMDGEWVPATPIAGTIVVNIGDLMAFWSGGRYKATKHRVRFMAKQGEGRQPPWSKDRYSMVLFSHPNRCDHDHITIFLSTTFKWTRPSSLG